MTSGMLDTSVVIDWHDPDVVRALRRDDLGRGGMEPPGLGAHKLQQEGVPASPVDHDPKCGVADSSTRPLDGLTEAALDIGAPN